MYEIYFYEDKDSISPVYDYIQSLSQKTDKDNGFILLHYFQFKKTQKTPKREIDQAKRNLKDMQERNESE